MLTGRKYKLEENINSSDNNRLSISSKVGLLSANMFS